MQRSFEGCSVAVQAAQYGTWKEDSGLVQSILRTCFLTSFPTTWERDNETEALAINQLNARGINSRKKLQGDQMIREQQC